MYINKKEVTVTELSYLYGQLQTIKTKVATENKTQRIWEGRFWENKVIYQVATSHPWIERQIDRNLHMAIQEQRSNSAIS